MNNEVILKVEGLSKQYRLGVLGTGALSHDLKRWFYKIRGKEDPFLKIGEKNNRETAGSSDYVWAIQDISFAVKRGDVLGIIGKNGAGKSTLLKILSKVTNPTKGVIKSNGRIASLLEVGTGFHPEMTGKENIFLNGAILGMTKKEITGKLDEIIEFSGCKRYIDTPVKRYSSGMKVRLAFAVAAFLEPDILIIDEVLAVGDAEFQKKAIGKMQDISNSEGRTVLFVSHDMAAIKSLCTRLVILDKGGVVFQGETEEGIAFYLNSKTNILDKKELLTIDNRNGTGDALFQSVSYMMENDSGELIAVNEIPTGKDFYIDLNIKNNTLEQRKINLAVSITDPNGYPVSSISNIFTNDILYLNSKANTKVRLYIEHLNLRAQSYYLTLWGDDDKGCFDKIEDAAELPVVESDFYNTGKYPKKKKNGIILFKSQLYVVSEEQ